MQQLLNIKAENKLIPNKIWSNNNKHVKKNN
jgi:hypothetical protein